ncbi:PAS domain S-box protein [Gilvimarinus sp. SDUM040013]|uniref:histidine kinase n=1 Tax=Gilvimarinus gilvus TaxID=3058038 RepID=A0ABU4S1J6_9GAMM|nr:PAS domain S-box protein [Gilvimarinus sp. SDUM040013]MDO3384721.1 PAS domain S-box protein [Gilvimarinus sp. SDUM040013]MDX6850804.1 PAS domain S-box protein [Gilvimarinus sp. SDUM040013]
MGLVRLRRFEWLYPLLLLAMFSLIVGFLWYQYRAVNGQVGQLRLDAEHSLWSNKLTHLENTAIERWRWLSEFAQAQAERQDLATSQHALIQSLWPGAVTLDIKPDGSWQAIPPEASKSLRSGLSADLACSDIHDSDWLVTRQEVYLVLPFTAQPSPAQCWVYLLPLVSFLESQFAETTDLGWLLTTPDGAMLSSGGAAVLVALQNHESMLAQPNRAIEIHASNGSPYLLMGFKLLGGEDRQALTLTISQPIDPTFDVLLHRSSWLHYLWLAVGLIGIAILFWVIFNRFRLNAPRRAMGANRLDLALESSQSGYWEWDIQTNKVEFSDHWKKMLGLTKGDWVKTGVDEWLRRIHPEDREQSYALLVAHLKSQTDMFEHEQRVLDRDGRYIWFLTRGKVSERDGQGRAQYMIGVYTRINERKQVDIMVSKQQKALQQLNEIATLAESQPQEQLRKSLSLGAQYLGLPIGIISHIRGDDYTIKVQHSPPDALHDGQVFSLPDCYCHDTLRLGDVLSMHHVKETGFATHPCYINTQLESYIGVPIWVAGEIYGTLNFSAPVARPEPFSETELDFVRLMARWVGGVLERWFREAESSRLSETFTKLSDSLPGCLCQFQMNRDGVMFFPYASRGILDVYGVTPEQIAESAASVIERIHEEDVERVGQSIMSSAETMTMWAAVYRYHHPDKGIVWVRGQTSPEKLDDGSVMWHGFLWDVTEEMLAQERLKYSNRWRQAILDAANVSFIATDRDGIIRTFNSGAEKMLGYNASEVEGKRDQGFIHVQEEVVKRAETLSQELGYVVQPGFDVFVEKIKRGGTDERKWTYIRKDGSRFPVILTATAVYDEEGNVDGYLGVGRDISEVESQREQLRVFAERTQTILNNAADGIIAIRSDGTIDTFNQSAERLFSWRAEDVVGRSVDILLAANETTSQSSFLELFKAGQKERAVGATRDLVGVRREGEQFPLELALSEIMQEGEPLYIAIVRDITERKRIDQMKSEFIATVSHELRTPLTAISGSLRLLDGGAMGALPAQVGRLVHIAYTNSSRLIHLVNDLLDMEKLVAGRMEFTMRPRLLAPLICSAIEENASYAAEHNVTFELSDEKLTSRVSDRPVIVSVDENRLKQVMANLLSNAAKFSPEGAKVTVRLEWEPKLVRVSIIDQGKGIPEEFRDQIFQKFSQVDSSSTRSKGGTGLGLAITKELVQRMDGHIGYDTHVGKGTRFYFTLPACLGSRFAARPPRVLPRVLQVEDDPDIREIVAILMQGCFDLTGVATVADAQTLLESEHYDLIILDVMLPDGSGLDLSSKIADTSSRGADIVVLSQVPLSTQQSRTYKAVIEKADQMADSLVELLDEWLDRYNER